MIYKTIEYLYLIHNHKLPYIRQIESMEGRKEQREERQPAVEFNKTVWIQTQSTTSNDHSHKRSADLEEQFKKQHQQYLALKMQRRQEEKKSRIQQFGQSSSDSDSDPEAVQQLPPKPIASPKSQPRDQQFSLKVFSMKSSSPSKSQKDHEQAHIRSVRKVEKQDRVGVKISSKKGVNILLEEEAVLSDKLLMLPYFQCAYYDISKLKLIFTDTGDRCFKIKANWKNEEIIFWSSNQKKHQKVASVFYIFAKIINSKMGLMGKKTLPTLELKSSGVPEAIIKNSLIYGKLLKKSRVISRWTQIFVVINQEGLVYYNKINQKGNLLIPRTSIAQLWTRFEFQDGWLVMKMFQGSHKIELGIPVQDELSGRGWLYHLYNLIFKI